MKKLILLTAGIGCLLQSQAQTQKEKANQALQQHQERVASLLATQSGSGAIRRPTGVAHRVKAQVIRPAGDPVDSTAYVYSGTRGSRMDYNYAYHIFNGGVEATYAPIPFIRTTIDQQGLFPDTDLAYLQADTIRRYSDHVLDYVQSAVYNAANRVLRTDMANISGYTRTIHHYDNQQHLLRSYQLESMDGGANYDTVSKREYTYNAAFTQLKADTIFMKNPTGGNYVAYNALNYHYGTSGRLDSVKVDSWLFTLIPTQKLTFDYYADGRLRKIYNTDNRLPDVPIVVIDSFGYAPGIDYAVYWHYDALVTQTGIDTFHSGWSQVKYPGSNGFPDSLRYYRLNEVSGDWEIEDKVVFYYTSFDEPDSLARYYNDGTFKGGYKFYYETYDNSVAIQPLSTGKDFRIYPNPVKDQLTIEWKGLKQTETPLRLVNMAGQEVYRSRMTLHQGSNRLQLPALPEGHYLLLIQDADGKTWSHRLLKQ